jgi:hypothetical protein
MEETEPPEELLPLPGGILPIRWKQAVESRVSTTESITTEPSGWIDYTLVLAAVQLWQS